MTTKECTKCGEVKPLSEYSKCNRYKDNHETFCRGCVKAKSREWYIKNKQKRLQQSKLWYDKNKKRHQKLVADWVKKKRKTDPQYKVIKSLRDRQRRAIKGNLKFADTKELLGCTYEEARLHLESQFTDGMSWDNYGLHGWHIDHIIPCASFDLSDPDQQRQCFHYTNLQPLWAEDNLRKSDKIL